ncbi:MAG: alpha/beta hydrolase [Bdellovibrionales bacterium]|nr:alpha/beta hydrolase [Bdellovibrionales bacterium]
MTKKKIAALILFVFFITTALFWLEAKYTANHFIYPDQGQYLQIDDMQIFYRQIGKGPDVMFVHGIGASQYIWKDVVEILRENFRLTLIDLPGFGRSSKIKDISYNLDSQTQYLVKIVQNLNLKSTNLVGSSMGGALALWTAKTHPELIDKVVAIGPATNPKLVPFAVYKFPQIAYLLQFFVNRLYVYLSLHKIFSNKSLITSHRIALSLKNQFNNSSSVYTFLKSVELLDDKRLPGELSQLQRPTLLLAGQKDQMVPVEYVKELQKIIPHSQLFIHPDAGHHLMEDDPQWVAHHLVEFFAR